MKHIQMRTSASGPDGTFQAGQVYKVADDLAATFVRAGAARELDASPEERIASVAEQATATQGEVTATAATESATEPVAEQATSRRSRGRGKQTDESQDESEGGADE